MQTLNAKTVTVYAAAASALGAMLLIAAIVAPSIGIGVYMTSGVWAALAVDLVDGTFYRPILSEIGYGGTRYVPLHFVLHAGLIRMFNAPVAAAYAIAYAAGLALFAGLFRCMRKVDVPAPLAAACAMLAFSALCVHACLYQLRPDILASAFNIWGLSFCIAPKQGRVRWIFWAAILFALAFLTKFTTVFGVAAAVLYLVTIKRRRDAAMLAGVTLVLSFIALLAIHAASGGRALESFLACATGGTTLRTLLNGPYRFFYTSRMDIPFLSLFAASLFALMARLRNGYRDLPIILFVLTLGATVIIASDMGAGINHFIDMQIAAAFLCAVQISRTPTNAVVRYALPACGAIGAITIIAALIYAGTYFEDSRYVQQDHIINLVGDGAQPLLSDDPWIPILAGERPIVLDNYLMRTISENDPAIAADLFKKIDHRFFRAAILFYGKKAPRGPNRNLNIEIDARRLYSSEMLYPEGFYERLAQHYAPIEFVGDYLVLLPR